SLPLIPPVGRIGLVRSFLLIGNHNDIRGAVFDGLWLSSVPLIPPSYVPLTRSEAGVELWFVSTHPSKYERNGLNVRKTFGTSGAVGSPFMIGEWPAPTTP